MRNFFLTIVFALLLPQFGFAQITPAIDQQISVKNYLTNGGFESGVAGWKTYKDAAGTTPVDATGGSPALTIAASATTPITGKSSGVITKSASNLQGEGVSVAFVTDKDARGKVVNITGSYEIVSGTYSGGTSSTDSDVELAIYDVDTSTYIQPTGYKLDGGVTGITYGFSATFQPLNLTSTNYRLALHVATTSASAYTLKLDGVKIGLYNKSQGPPVTDWTSFTPTGAWVANTTYTGFYKRVGDTMEVQVHIALAGAPTSAGLTVNLPSGFSVDTAKLANATSTNLIVGQARLTDSGNDTLSGVVTYNSSTSVQVYTETGADPSLGFVTQAAPWTWGNADFLNLYFKVPISGWASTVTMSDSADTRIVAMTAEATSGSHTSSGAYQDVTSWSAASQDTHGGFVAATGVYTVPVAGTYLVSASISFAANATGNRVTRIFKNGATVVCAAEFIASASITPPGVCTRTIALVAGDTLKVQTFQASGGTLAYQTASGYNYFNVSRISGPAQIAPTETVAARYSSTAGQSISTGTTTIIDFATKDFDTHGAVTTGASWKFTAPIAGKYRVSSYVLFASASFTATNSVALDIHKNGSGSTDRFFAKSSVEVSATMVPATYGTTMINLAAGDYIDVRVLQDSGGSRSLSTLGTAVWVEIERIGN